VVDEKDLWRGQTRFACSPKRPSFRFENRTGLLCDADDNFVPIAGYDVVDLVAVPLQDPLVSRNSRANRALHDVVEHARGDVPVGLPGGDVFIRNVVVRHTLRLPDHERLGERRTAVPGGVAER
jgi:hypothetical protein